MIKSYFIKWNLQICLCFQNVSQHTAANSLIHSTKQHYDNQLECLGAPCAIFYSKEIFLRNIQP